MEEGRAGKWRNEGGEAGRGAIWSEGGREGREGDAGRGRAWSERRWAGREINEAGEADRGRARNESEGGIIKEGREERNEGGG